MALTEQSLLSSRSATGATKMLLQLLKKVLTASCNFAARVYPSPFALHASRTIEDSVRLEGARGSNARPCLRLCLNQTTRDSYKDVIGLCFVACALRTNGGGRGAVRAAHATLSGVPMSCGSI